MLIFKLERERPAFGVFQNSLYYTKDKHIRHYDFATGNDVAAIGIRKNTGLNMQHRTLSYNPAEHAVVVTSVSIKMLRSTKLQPAEGGQYEVYQLPKEFGTAVDAMDASNDAKRGVGNAAVFIARNRYVVLNRSAQVRATFNII